LTNKSKKELKQKEFKGNQKNNLFKTEENLSEKLKSKNVMQADEKN